MNAVQYDCYAKMHFVTPECYTMHHRADASHLLLYIHKLEKQHMIPKGPFGSLHFEGIEIYLMD
jgi:hypothetical protein